MTSRDEKIGAGHIALHAGPQWLARLAILVPLAFAPACQRQELPLTASPHASGTAEETDQAPAEEIWEAFYLQGTKIGYGHTTTRPASREGRQLIQIRSTNHLAITRFGQQTKQDVSMEMLETPDGEVVQFKTEVGFGPSPAIVTGRAGDDEMTITTQTQGRSETARIAWSSDVRGFRAIEQSLAREPMKPGRRRSFKMLMPLLNQIVETELAAQDYEQTPVLGVEARLLRVEGVARMPSGQSIQSTLWTDEQGQVIKTRVEALGQESFRTTRELAKAPGGKGTGFDLGLDLTVHVDPPLERAHQTREVRYRVELAKGDPATAFATGPTQSVRSLGDHTAEVTVRRLRPGDLTEPAEPPAEVASEYTSAGSILQIDDPRIRQMAREAQGNATDPTDVAIALESYVNRVVSEKNFSHGFATAAEVAESREGDCTEHAVLLAALARACGIPSRVAIGLVYVERAGGFGYHMWTEVYLHGQWVPLDAIMGPQGTSAAYLKLADSSLDGANAYSSFLAVAQVLGQLKVSVLESQ